MAVGDDFVDPGGRIRALMGEPTSGPTDLLSALQNAVTALNAINTTLNLIFPRSVSVSTAAATAGTITFTSSQAAGFYTTTSSSGFTYKVPLYT